MAVKFSFDPGSTSRWAQIVKDELPAKGLAGMKAAVHEGARLIQAEAKSDAPKHIAGTITIDEKVSRFGARAAVGPTAPDARRWELGFHGTDARGRDYSSPGFGGRPYMGPGARRALGQLSEVFRASAAAALAA
jgi:hypothetical protein